MTALPVAAPLRLVDGVQLSPAAAVAADTSPAALIERWLADKAPTARRTYSRSLRQFGSWATGTTADEPTGMRLLIGSDAGTAHAMVEAWRDHLLAGGLAPGSVGAMVTGLASLVRCCRRAGLIAWRLEGVVPAPERRHDRSGPGRGTVERLFATIDAAADVGDRQAVRDAAIVRLAYCCGLRRAEIVGLQVEDVDLSAPAVRVVRKGRRERAAVTVSAGTAVALQRWLDARGAESGWLFTRTDRAGGTAQTPIDASTVWRLLARWARLAGIAGPIRPHGLRHSGATEVAARGSLASLQAFGQWSTLSAAAGYLDRRAQDRAAALAVVDL